MLATKRTYELDAVGTMTPIFYSPGWNESIKPTNPIAISAGSVKAVS